MPDQKFAIKAVKKTSAAYAAKIATLWPVMRCRSLSDKIVQRDTMRLLKRWRRRIYKLYQLGWGIVDKPGRLQLVRNCPPFGVVTKNRNSLRTCKLTNICPWCWMRHTVCVFNKFATCLGLPDRGSLSKSVHKLVEVSAHLTMSREDAGEYLDGHLLQWANIPKTVIRAIKPLGAYRTITVAPTSVAGHKIAWRFSYRVLAMVPNDWTMPDRLRHGPGKVRITDVHSKSDLVNAVARTCRYPPGLLRGSPQMVLTALNARSRRRCSEFTGCLYSKKSSGETNDNNGSGS